jgi:predicted permease
LIARVLDRVRALPDVDAVGLTSTIPFSGANSDSVILAEGYQMAPGESVVSPNQVIVTDGYFEAMGARLVAGRFFTDADVEDRQRVVIVDERLARRFWPNGEVIGKRMYQPESAEKLLEPPGEERMLTVVGVIADMRLSGLVDGGSATRVGAYYFPFRQAPRRSMGLAIRGRQDLRAVTESIRRALAQVDPELPLYNVRTMAERTSEVLVDRRTPTLLATGFAVVALFLSAIGIYGVLAYQVSQRRREIGIRMALGAGAPRIFSLVLGEGAAIVLAGAAAGLLGAYLLRRSLESLLYGVSAMDAAVVAMVASVLVAVATVACIIPARRAARTDPTVALTEQ